MKKYNAVISFCSVALGALILYLSRDFVRITNDGIPGERFWPEIIAWLFIGLGVILFITETVIISKGKNRDVDLSSLPIRKAYLAGAITLLYGILLIYAGFIIATLVFLPCIMFLMGERKPRRIILSSVCTTMVIYLVFTMLFHSELPTSILFG